MNKRESHEAALAAIKERMEDYQTALSNIASSDNGELVLRAMYLACGMAKALNPAKVSHAEMCWWEGRREFYLTAVRPFLTAEQRLKIERIDNE